MAECNFQLRGWHALVGILVLVGFIGVKVWLRICSVDDEMRDAVRVELLQEYSGRGPKDVARIVTEAREGLPIEPVPEVVQRDIEFSSMGAHGKIGAHETLVRAEITVDGGAPPDGRAIRYFRISRKYGGGWMVVGETNSYLYYNELLP